eukprot:TRINITY_DN11488_c0_g1_i1.p1 TRINITY_DN11488_c0_g1~~TRINITY_DN11488_c0_g1_i1.p1  ORF type:complete len:705 (+),score=225.17 TRINITY_DN11488_c0_g1_i1:216-2330(+)
MDAFGGFSFDEPSSKRLRIAIEPHAEKKIYHISPDGKEQALVEPTPSEKFARLVRQIDFEALNLRYSEARKGKNVEKEEDQLLLGKDEKQDEDDRQIKKADPAQQKWPWQSVAESLYHARAEIDQMIGLIDLLQTNPQNPAHLSIHHIPKPSQSLASFNADLAVRQLSKQKELAAASDILAQGAQSLKAIIDREKVFFDDLLQIRHGWLITNRSTLQRGPKQNLLGGSKQLGKLYVDYSFRTAGSKVRAEAELVQSPSGHVSVVFPTSNISKVLHFSTAKSHYQGRTESTEENENPSKQLSVAQSSIFFMELCQQLADDAMQSSLTGVQVLENEVKLENDSDDSSLTIRLKSAKQNQPIINVGDSFDSSSSLPFAVVEIILYQLLRRRHIGAIADIATAEKGKPTPNPSSHVLSDLVTLYRHSCFCAKVNAILHVIASDIPNAAVHWYSTGKQFISAFEIQFGKSFSLEISIDKVTPIFASGKASMLSAEELGSFVQVQLCTSIAEEIRQEASSLLVGAEVRREVFTVTVSHPKKTTSIRLVPQKNMSVDVLLSESFGETSEPKKSTYKFRNIPGADITEKIYYLLFHSNVQARSVVSGVTAGRKGLISSGANLKLSVQNVKKEQNLSPVNGNTSNGLVHVPSTGKKEQQVEVKEELESNGKSSKEENVEPEKEEEVEEDHQTNNKKAKRAAPKKQAREPKYRA